MSELSPYRYSISLHRNGCKRWDSKALSPNSEGGSKSTGIESEAEEQIVTEPAVSDVARCRLAIFPPRCRTGRKPRIFPRDFPRRAGRARSGNAALQSHLRIACRISRCDPSMRNRDVRVVGPSGNPDFPGLRISTGGRESYTGNRGGPGIGKCHYPAEFARFFDFFLKFRVDEVLDGKLDFFREILDFRGSRILARAQISDPGNKSVYGTGRCRIQAELARFFCFFS